jgi:hypothetical protein
VRKSCQSADPCAIHAGYYNLCQLRREARAWKLRFKCRDRRSQNQLLIGFVLRFYGIGEATHWTNGKIQSQ